MGGRVSMAEEVRTIARVLVANRGEIAIRVLRAAAELGIEGVAVHSEDDGDALHTKMATRVRRLQGRGPAAYLNVEGIIEAARAEACDAIHPGYGFLSENAELARRCAEEGIVFVGPPAQVLAALGDKVRARELAEE